MPDGARIASSSIDMPPAELFIWLSPAFPTGGFAFSHGLERLAEAGVVGDRASLTGWLRDLSHMGSLRNDLIVLTQAWRAAESGRSGVLDEVAELAFALAPTAERRLETSTQGNAFAMAVDAAWSSPSVRHLQQRHAGRIAYPVAVGAAAGDRAVDLAATLLAYAIAFAGNLVSAAIRLGIIGQFDGQRVLADLVSGLRHAAEAALTATLDDLGGAMLLGDIASMEHETQYTRLFRS